MKKIFYLSTLIFFNYSISSTEITIGFVGDVMLGRLVGKFVKHNRDYSHPWGNLLPLLHSTDFNIANLETTLTRSRDKAPKIFNFKSDPKNVQALSEANISFVNLANNHILDFGIRGLNDTLIALDKKGILHAGADQNLIEAQKPAYITKDSLTFAIISATDNEPDWIATKSRPGINFMNFNEKTAESLATQIRELKKSENFVIVSVHWGPNWNTRPSVAFQKFAHRILDAGADLIHGHSPHIFQGIEIYNDKLIIYSAGDFLDDYAVNKELRNDQSFLFLTTFDNQGLKELRLIPVKVSDFQVNKAPYAEAQKMIVHMQKLSLELGTIIPRNGIWQRKNNLP